MHEIENTDKNGRVVVDLYDAQYGDLLNNGERVTPSIPRIRIHFLFLVEGSLNRLEAACSAKTKYDAKKISNHILTLTLAKNLFARLQVVRNAIANSCRVDVTEVLINSKEFVNRSMERSIYKNRKLLPALTCTDYGRSYMLPSSISTNNL